VVPSIHAKEDILEIFKWIKPAKKYFLQNFRPEKTIDPKFEEIKPYLEKDLAKICNTMSPFFDVCRVR